MGNMTVALPDDLQERMRKHKEIRWSEVVRQAISQKVKRLESLGEMDHTLRNSQLTKEDIEEISSKIKREVFQEMEKKYS